MLLSNDSIAVKFDLLSGYTTSICDPKDRFGMNWILENSDWGAVEGFTVLNVEKNADGISVTAENSSKTLSLSIIKRVFDGKYQEQYRLTNISDSEYSLNRDSFGIHFPYNCIFENKQNLLDNSCITHIWCGGDITWMYSARPSGKKPYLVCYNTEGSFSDYSISYDISRVLGGCNYRGDIVLHPTDCIIPSGEALQFSLVFMFENKAPDTAEAGKFCEMRLFADKYSAFAGEEINCGFECAEKLDGLELFCNGEKIQYEINGKKAVWKFSSDKSGENKIVAKLNGKQTWMCLNVLEPLSDILHKRAKFITEKQQYHKKGSPIDGAYLIYDRCEDELVYSSSFNDSNACRERLALGTVVALALQKKFDSSMMKSLAKHREFVEREIFDVETATVFNEVGRNNNWLRAYNYPWMSDYYLEWYLLTKEIQCIKNAARILINYYDQAGGIKQESPCMRPIDVCNCLEKEGLLELKQTLIDRISAHAARIIQQGDLCYSQEVTCTQGMFNGKITLLCQAYLLTGNKEYLSLIPSFLEKADCFCAMQPDFHTNSIAVRYWDLCWFGKSKTYGDSMPQWLSAWSGEVYNLLCICGFAGDFKQRCENVLKNNLCVYDKNGFGSAGYLVPYRVTQYSSDPEYSNAYMTPGVAFGHKYDDFSNDQDWALYFAVKILMQ